MAGTPANEGTVNENKTSHIDHTNTIDYTSTINYIITILNSSPLHQFWCTPKSTHTHSMFHATGGHGCPDPDEMLQMEPCNVHSCHGYSWLALPWQSCHPMPPSERFNTSSLTTLEPGKHSPCMSLTDLNIKMGIEFWIIWMVQWLYQQRNSSTYQLCISQLLIMKDGIENSGSCLSLQQNNYSVS
jgi:hypothetical protein